MPFPPSRPSSVLAGVLAVAGIVLAMAGCGHVAPIGPTPPQQRHLGSPIILQATRAPGLTSAHGCPAGSLAFAAPGDTSSCYPKLGPPVTLSSAAISPIMSGPTATPPGQKKGIPSYGFVVVVPPADVAAVTAIIKQAYDSKGALAISVAGKVWTAPQVFEPFPGQQLQIFVPSKNQALQLRRILVPST
jgi:hypothetical protein